MNEEFEELKKEYEKLLPFKELVELLTDIFDFEYFRLNNILTLTVREPYGIEKNDFINIYLIEEDSNVFLRALEILESENDIEQD